MSDYMIQFKHQFHQCVCVLKTRKFSFIFSPLSVSSESLCLVIWEWSGKEAHQRTSPLPLPCELIKMNNNFICRQGEAFCKSFLLEFPFSVLSPVATHMMKALILWKGKWKCLRNKSIATPYRYYETFTPFSSHTHVLRSFLTLNKAILTLGHFIVSRVFSITLSFILSLFLYFVPFQHLTLPAHNHILNFCCTRWAWNEIGRHLFRWWHIWIMLLEDINSTFSLVCKRDWYQFFFIYSYLFYFSLRRKK
jgi:hypothetical protein